MNTIYKAYGNKETVMCNYIISCCSTVDLPKEYFEERDIHYICFHYELDGKAYEDDFGQSLSFEELYTKMKQGADTKTSQINVAEYEAYFAKFLEQGKDILHVCVSSGVSGAYNSANLAKNILQEKYSERKIYLVDSLGGSSGSGLLMDKIADLRDSGKSIDELYMWAKENRLKMQHWLFSTDLTYFIKGGRISKTAGFVGSVLNICPVMSVSKEGKIVPRYKVRTKKKVIESLVKQMEENAKDGLDYSDKCYISHSGCYEDARAVADLVERRFGKLREKVKINNIGTAIGCHAGPGTVGLFFWGKERVW